MPIQLPLVREPPDLDVPTEADAGGYRAGAAARGADVVAAEFVGVGDGLLEREGCGRGAVDAEDGGAACGEEGGGCGREGEDLGWVRCDEGVSWWMEGRGHGGVTDLRPPCER